MKQLFFMAAMLFSITAAAQQCTFVNSVSTNYKDKKVTFNISWAENSRGVVGTNTYNHIVWVFVDYQEVRNNMPYGNWKRAEIDTLVQLPANCTVDRGNTKGFWYQGQPTARQDTTITVKLSSTLPAQFKWCAFAIDSPPNAVYNSNSNYTLKGTPPFEITYNIGNSTASTTTSNRIFTAGTITKITDATKCPGNILQPHTTCEAANLVLGTVGFANQTTYSVGGKIWSSPVTATACNKTTLQNFNSAADCRSHPSYAGDLFTWCMVTTYQNILCPSPWRVPTRQDFIVLDVALGGSGVNREGDVTTLTKYLARSGTLGQFWGAEFGGNAFCGGSLGNQNLRALYWSSTETNTNNAHQLDIGNAQFLYVWPDGSGPKCYGFRLRCVQDL